MATKLCVLLLSSLLFKDVLGLSVGVQPQQQIAKQGDQIRVICRVAEPLESCSFDIPNEPPLNLRPDKMPFNGIKYYGEGLDRGVCGLEMTVKDHHNGVIKCLLTPRGQPVSTTATSSLVVAKKPNSPEMSITGPSKVPNAYMENEQVTATCSVKNGRPAANITWYIGETKITEGLTTPTEQESQLNSLFTISQNLTRKVRSSDNGKMLKCVAGHLLLNNNENTIARQLTVVFAPKPSPGSLDHFGLVEGEEGKITVTVTGNPKPSLTWKIGDIRIHEGESDSESGRFKAEKAIENRLKGSGYWDATLIINPLEKEDVEKEYVLVATNTYGEQTYKVTISTNPEPRMLELGAGTIVGIVVAILLILVITSILVFARAKGRWCFAGKSGPRLAGESSDTESAEHHHASGPKAKMTFTKVFKKKNDKESTEEEEIKTLPVVDEKNVTCAAPTKEEDAQENLNPTKTDEGVVYAELDLQNPTPAARGVVVRPEDDKTEYAEIIHTQQNNNK